MSSIMLSVVSGEGLVHQLMMVLIVGVCVAIIWALGRWTIVKFALPALVLTVWNGLFLFVGAFCLINFLLGLAGYPLIKW